MSDTQREKTVQQVVLWMVSNFTGDRLREAIVSKLGAAPEEVTALVEEAKRRITLAATFDRDEMVGKALMRLEDLYSRYLVEASTNPAYFAKALDVQREINRLAGLYKQAELSIGVLAGGDGDEQLAQVAAHLLPLQLADERMPLVEHARLAAVEIVRLRQQAGEVAAAQGET